MSEPQAYFATTPLVLRIKEAARLLGSNSPSTIYRLAGEGRIRILKLNGASVVPYEDMQVLVRMLPVASGSAPTASTMPAPRRRGRPRKERPAA